MTWFEELTGFREVDPAQVRRNIVCTGETLTSNVNGKMMTCGYLEIPSLSILRERVPALTPGARTLSVKKLIADVQALHEDVAHAGSLFQVASQFNLLEMMSPWFTPELGVGLYEADPTQGPSCAIAAGAGTIYRNYFVPVNGHIGQTATHQIDGLADLGRALGNEDGHLWRMQNGYVLATPDGLSEIATRLRAASEAERDELRQLLRIGLQWNTQVTLRGLTHLVSQAYGSALPVAYSDHPAELWEPFARLVLEASYEATLCAAIVQAHATGNNRVFLTRLGGGAFGNDHAWILDAMHRALTLYADWDLDVVIVARGPSR